MGLMTVQEQIQTIRRALRSPVSPEEDADGWTTKSKEAANNYLGTIEAALASGNRLPPLGIVRGLDHWGVVGGELLESIATVSNLLRDAYASK